MSRKTAVTKRELMDALSPLPDTAFIKLTYVFASEEMGYGSVGGPISYIKIDPPEPEYEYDGQATLVIDDKYLSI